MQPFTPEQSVEINRRIVEMMTAVMGVGQYSRACQAIADRRAQARFHADALGGTSAGNWQTLEAGERAEFHPTTGRKAEAPGDVPQGCISLHFTVGADGRRKTVWRRPNGTKLTHQEGESYLRLLSGVPPVRLSRWQMIRATARLLIQGRHADA